MDIIYGMFFACSCYIYKWGGRRGAGMVWQREQEVVAFSNWFLCRKSNVYRSCLLLFKNKSQYFKKFVVKMPSYCNFSVKKNIWPVLFFMSIKFDVRHFTCVETKRNMKRSLAPLPHEAWIKFEKKTKEIIFGPLTLMSLHFWLAVIIISDIWYPPSHCSKCIITKDRPEETAYPF